MTAVDGTESTPTADSVVTSSDAVLDYVVLWITQADEEKHQGGAAVSFPVTLHVHGALITGDLISRRQWLAEFDSTWPSPAGRRFAIADQIRDDFTLENDQVEHFIHLKNTRTLVGTTFVPSEQVSGSLWRGQLSHVSGFSFGKFETLQ